MRGVVLNERVRVRRQLLKTQREWKRGNPGFTSQKTGAEGEEGEGAGQGTWHARKSASHTQLQMRVVERKSVWRLPQQQFPFPPTADTMKIVSENNAICRRRVGRNFGVAQFICTVDRELCQGCDVWTTTADLSLCIQPPLFVGRTRQSVYFVIIALFVVTIPFCLELQSQTRFASCDKPVFSQRSVLVYTALCASELVFATVSFLLISFPLL